MKAYFKYVWTNHAYKTEHHIRFASLQCLKLAETINIFIYPVFFGVPTVCIAEKQPRKFKDSENFITTY